MGVGGQSHALASAFPGKRLGAHFSGGWVASGPVWTAAEYLVTAGDEPRWGYFVDWNLSSKICGDTFLFKGEGQLYCEVEYETP